jgi:tripartite-type tricarboxylate transporter receptor subunit TctC
MPHRRRRLLLAIAATAAGARASRASPALAFPARPITIVVPFPSGGSSDGVARLLATGLRRVFNQTVVVENRSAAAGSLPGLSQVARAVPDGYTLAIGSTGGVAIIPHTAEGAGFDPLRALAPVARLATVPLVLVAAPGAGLASIADVVERSRDAPAGLPYGSSGTNTAQHLAVALLARETGARLVHVPYRGSAPAVTDLLAGRVPMASVDLTTAIGGIRAGSLRAVAVFSAERSALAPDVPTAAESGAPGFAAAGWLGLFAPAGTPAPKLRRLSLAVGAVLAEPEARARVQDLAAEPDYADDAAFAAFLAAESARWRAALAALGHPG